MSIARNPPPKCPNHPTQDMVVAFDTDAKGHDSKDMQAIVIWNCPIENHTFVSGTYRMNRPNT